MRTLLAVGIAILCAGCASPRAIDAPTLPVALATFPGPHAAATTVPAIPSTGRPDELDLADHHFHPTLKAAFTAYLRSELGQKHATAEITIERLTVKIKSMAPPSDRGEAVAMATRSASYSMPPGTPAGAGLVGALIGAAILEAAKSGEVHARVLVGIEGRIGEQPFAGFAHGAYDPARHDSIEKAIREAFVVAKASIQGEWK